MKAHTSESRLATDVNPQMIVMAETILIKQEGSNWWNESALALWTGTFPAHIWVKE